MFLLYFFVGCVFLIQCSFGYPGQYIPKSYYKIDNNGIESDIVSMSDLYRNIRVRRDANPSNEQPNFGGGFFPPDFINSYIFPEKFFQQFQTMFKQNVIDPINNQARNIPDGNYDGPNTKARQGTLQGVDGVQVASRASGPNGAFSYSSTSVDSDGNAHYSSKTHQY